MEKTTKSQPEKGSDPLEASRFHEVLGLAGEGQAASRIGAQSRPVILIGHGRSGTSILSRLMRENLGIAFGTESQFIVDYYRRLTKYESLRDDRNLRRLVDDLLRERWFQRSRKFNDFQLDAASIVASVEDRTYAGVLDAIFTLFAKHLGMQRWGDKTPAYIHHLDVIYKLFPHAQYVYLVRDGRDVASSVMKSYFGPNNIYTAARDWKRTILKGDAFVASLPPAQLHYLRYEDLVRDPVNAFKSLADYLEIDGRAGELASELESQMPTKLLAGNFDKWRTSWSPRQQRTFERYAGDALNKHGYETSVRQPDEVPGIVTRTYWNALNAITKYRHLEYWQDNFYKARLRLSRLVR